MRIRDPGLLIELHLRWRECALCGATEPLSLHHIANKPRDDVEANLVMVCGSGTTGCHGLIEARDPLVRWSLALHVHDSRPDTTGYLAERYPVEGAHAWLRRVYGACERAYQPMH